MITYVTLMQLNTKLAKQSATEIFHTLGRQSVSCNTTEEKYAFVGYLHFWKHSDSPVKKRVYWPSSVISSIGLCTTLAGLDSCLLGPAMAGRLWNEGVCWTEPKSVFNRDVFSSASKFSTECPSTKHNPNTNSSLLNCVKQCKRMPVTIHKYKCVTYQQNTHL